MQPIVPLRPSGICIAQYYVGSTDLMIWILGIQARYYSCILMEITVKSNGSVVSSFASHDLQNILQALSTNSMLMNAMNYAHCDSLVVGTNL